MYKWIQVCGSVRSNVLQCAAIRGSVRQFVAVCGSDAAVCGNGFTAIYLNSQIYIGEQ
jgi:hypothetical protein